MSDHAGETKPAASTARKPPPKINKQNQRYRYLEISKIPTQNTLL